MTPSTPLLSEHGAADSHRLCVAPMLDWTDRHYRYFARLLSRRTRLYTEMVTATALHYGDVQRHLAFDPSEHPLALQLGGSDPLLLANGARYAAEFGYDEINLNVGCPSPRVSQGRFGACLMLEPELVADCVAALRAASDVPVTVKTRIGVDDHDDFDFLCRFIETVARAGCELFIIHARKAWLQGLSPKENREIPPLDYSRLPALKQAFPHLRFVLNGGIVDLDQAEAQLAHADGVMIGRAAYHTPYLLANVDQRLFGDSHAVPSRLDIVEQLIPYAERQLAQGVRLHTLTRHWLGLFHGEAGGRHWRRTLSEFATRPHAGVEVLHQALAKQQSVC